MLPATEQRVATHKSEHVNRRIREQTDLRVAECNGSLDPISAQLNKLDRE